ncbi:hypothetical protein ACFYST_04440 [Kitasatospora sp. NPDC004614]|uniref:hypothetical protein n=1 Tax=unclassified Kitasatospora TaxID=2633591 RepID=UPI00369F9821
MSAVLDLDGTVDTIFGSAAPDAKAEVKSQFTQRGFVVAMRHAWTAPDGTQSFTVLMRFSDDAGAEGMASRLAEGLKSTYPDTVFTDPGDLSTGAVVNIDDHGKALVELVAPHGDVVVFMNYLTPAAPDKKTALVRFHSHLTMLPTPGLPWQ